MKVRMIPIETGVLSSIPKGFLKKLEGLEIRGQVETTKT